MGAVGTCGIAMDGNICYDYFEKMMYNTQSCNRNFAGILILLPAPMCKREFTNADIY